MARWEPECVRKSGAGVGQGKRLRSSLSLAVSQYLACFQQAESVEEAGLVHRRPGLHFARHVAQELLRVLLCEELLPLLQLHGHNRQLRLVGSEVPGSEGLGHFSPLPVRSLRGRLLRREGPS